MAAVGGAIIVLFGLLAPAEGITVTTQGSPAVGSDFRFLLTVRESDFRPSSGLYLSLEGLNGTFEITAPPAGQHPGNRLNVWNLSGMDLSRGMTFILDTTPTWAAEMVLHATLWSPVYGFAGVRFINGDSVDSTTVRSLYMTPVPLTTTWPLATSASPDAPMTLGQESTLVITVQGTLAGPRTPSLLYVEVVTKSIYYTLAGANTGGDPMNQTLSWNITGMDVSRGIELRLTATPAMAGKGVPFDVRVWSPRSSLNEPTLGIDGRSLNGGGSWLWADTTFSFSVTV